MYLPSLVELLFYVIWKQFITFNLPAYMHALFYQLDQAEKQPCEMRAQRPGVWQQVQ